MTVNMAVVRHLGFVGETLIDNTIETIEYIILD